MTKVIRSKGFSLTELLVAMVVGLFLLGGIVTLMVNSKKNYTQQDYSARLQENARFAVQFLSYDIRMAGYWGCSSSIGNDNTIVPMTATQGASGATDSVTIVYGEPYDAGADVVLTTGYDPYGSNPEILALNAIPGDWSDGNTLVISDCGGAAVATIATGGINTSSNEVTVTSANFGRVFDPMDTDKGAITVRRLVSNAYQVNTTTGASGIPVLERNGLELVEGVENLQLLFQALSGGAFADASSGVPATLAAVQLGALVRSVSNENLNDREYGPGIDIAEDDGAYTVLNQDVSGATGSIRGQRRVFSSVLQVRNRPR